jgi:hypothetical protein
MSARGLGRVDQHVETQRTLQICGRRLDKFGLLKEFELSSERGEHIDGHLGSVSLRACRHCLNKNENVDQIFWQRLVLGRDRFTRRHSALGVSDGHQYHPVFRTVFRLSLLFSAFSVLKTL